MNTTPNSTSLIARAVEPLRDDAVQKAHQRAIELVAEIEADLSAHDWNINVCAPMPDSGTDRRTYSMARGKAMLYDSVTKLDESRSNRYEVSRWRSKEYFVDMDPEGVEKFYNQTREDASAQYDAFIAKMEGKIGVDDLVEVTLEGSHVWGYSFLTVTRKDGSREVWKTQQIVNVSKLGRLFNQWPSRLQKGGK